MRTSARLPAGLRCAGMGRWVLALFCLMGPLSGAPSDPLQAAQHAFRLYLERDGLPHRNVLALTRDRQGYLWAGTANGIARFDGRTWQTQTLPAGVIPFVNANAAASLADGSVAFGTRNDGLLISDAGTWSVVNKASELGVPNVNAILEAQAPDGGVELWVGTWGGGVSRRNAKGWRTFRKEDGLPSDQIFCLLEVGKGAARQIWAGTENGISLFEGGAWRPLGAAEKLAGAHVQTLAVTEAPRTVWIGTQNRGLWFWDGALHPPEDHGLQEGNIRSLWADQDRQGGPLLAAASAQGLSIREGGQWRRIWREQGFPASPARSVLHMALPPSRRLFWIGTEGQGLLRYTDSSWRRFPLPPAFQDHRVQAVLPRAQPGGQEVWVGGPEGLGRWSQGAWTTFGLKEGLPHSSVRALHAPPGDAGFWIGTELGLARWENGRIHAIAEPGLRRVVRCIASDQGPAGPRLWVGLSTGLAVREGAGRWRILLKADGLPDASIRCILPDPGTHRVWVGTDGGVGQWDGTRWRAWTRKEGLPSTWVMSLSIPPASAGTQVWVGHFGGGLGILQEGDEGWEVHKTSTLPEGIVAAQAWDGPRHVFLGTHRGVLRGTTDPQGFPSGAWESQGLEDGLPGLEISPGTFQVDALGRFWLGTTEGLGLWDPGCAGEDRRAKPLHWAQLKVGGADRNLAPGAVLGYRQNTLLFTAHLLSLFHEAETGYQWQLEGLEAAPGAWTNSASRELVGLRDGSYTLKVWGRDYAGNVSGPLLFPFQIQPAPWRHPLAYLGYLLLLLGGIGQGVRWRTQALNRKNRALEARILAATADLVEREKSLLYQAQNLEQLNEALQALNERKNEIIGIAAHDLRSPLSGILMATEILQDPEEAHDPEGVQQLAGKIHKAGLNMMELLQRLLDGNAIDLGNVKPENRPFDLAEIAREVQENNRQRAAGKQQILKLQAEAEEVTAYADPRYVRDVLENLVSNALKFSPRGGAIRLVVGRGAASAWVEVQDDGPGLTQEDQGQLFQRYTRLSARPTGGEPSVGLGLSIVKGYVEAMGGSIGVASEPGQGATFRVELPTF